VTPATKRHPAAACQGSQPSSIAKNPDDVEEQQRFAPGDRVKNARGAESETEKAARRDCSIGSSSYKED
jgi:hypothetical protein